MNARLLSLLMILLVISCKKTSVTDTEQPPVNSDAPSSLSASSISQNGFQLNWLFTGTDSVKVFVARDSLFAQPVNGFNGVIVKDTKLVVSGLSPDTVYFCQVKTSRGLASNLLKVTTSACALSAISRDTDPSTRVEKQLDILYDNQNRIVKTVSFSSANRPLVTADIIYAADGSVASIKETENNILGDIVFDMKIQGRSLIGTGKRQSSNLYDSLQIDLIDAAGTRKRVKMVSAFLTGAAPSDTLKIITDQAFNYNSSGQLIAVVETQQTDRISPTGVKQTVAIVTKQFTYEYQKGLLLKIDLSVKNSSTNTFAVVQTTEFEYDLNILTPKGFFLDTDIQGFSNFIRSRVIFPPMTNPSHLIKNIKTSFRDPSAILSESVQSFEYGFKNNVRIPQTVRSVIRSTRKSDGARIVNDPVVNIYTTNCN